MTIGGFLIKIVTVLVMISQLYCEAFTTTPTTTIPVFQSRLQKQQQQQNQHRIPFVGNYFQRSCRLFMSDSETNNDSVPQPKTFREAEVLGLKYMQERKFEDALKGTHDFFLLLGIGLAFQYLLSKRFKFFL